MFHLGGLYSDAQPAIADPNQPILVDEYYNGATQPSTQIISTKRAGSASESLVTTWTGARDEGFAAFSVGVLLANQTQIITAL